GGSGTLQAFGVSPTAGGLNGDSTAFVENGSATNSTFIMASTTAANTFNGTFQNGAGGGSLAVRVQSGTLTIGGTNTNTGGYVVRGGKLIMSGGQILTPNTAFTIGDTANSAAVFEMDGGVLNASFANSGISFQTSATNTGPNQIADFRMNGGVIT